MVSYYTQKKVSLIISFVPVNKFGANSDLLILTEEKNLCFVQTTEIDSSYHGVKANFQIFLLQ